MFLVAGQPYKCVLVWVCLIVSSVLLFSVMTEVKQNIQQLQSPSDSDRLTGSWQSNIELQPPEETAKSSSVEQFTIANSELSCNPVLQSLEASRAHRTFLQFSVPDRRDVKPEGQNVLVANPGFDWLDHCVLTGWAKIEGVFFFVFFV